MADACQLKVTYLTESIVVVNRWCAIVRKSRFPYQREIETRTIAKESKPVLPIQTNKQNR